ncbi:efflux RND transporter permease subunit, partial [Ralstonia solanacearum species complex bacterium KE100]|uniref:efflux RND transporter permease subunit n=1 Tax=Ralstonia solanacearum species complex bacterium KE100 TaxID=3119581 RepID=UPI002FC2806C
GAAGALRIPVALFPQVDFPRVQVSLSAGDRPADQMVVAVTQPVEQAVRAIPAVVNVRSTTSRGSAELSVSFAWGTDMVVALQQVESAASHATAAMPPGSSFTARRMDPTVFPIAAYSLTSPTVDLVALRDLAEYQLLPLLSSIEGVGRIGVLGGDLREYRA